MKNKKILGLILAIIIIILFICGAIIYSNKSQANITKNTKSLTNNSTKENPKVVTTNTNTSVNSTSSAEKPKMLNKKEIAEKEQEAAKTWKIKEEDMKKQVSLNELKENIVIQGTNLLIKEFPNELKNKTKIENKLTVIINKDLTSEVMKDKLGLDGPEYDLNKIGVEITPVNSLGFALNINTNQLIENSNKDIAITNTHSAN